MAAGLTAGTRHDNRGIGVIRKRRRECHGGVTSDTFHGNTWMPRRTGIGVGSNRDSAVVTGRAASGDIRVIESSVRVESDETERRVAVATFLRGNDVMVRLANGDDAIMTGAAVAEYFVMIDKAGDVKSYR
jgi:hypothetical protein